MKSDIVVGQFCDLGTTVKEIEVDIAGHRHADGGEQARKGAAQRGRSSKTQCRLTIVRLTTNPFLDKFWVMRKHPLTYCCCLPDIYRARRPMVRAIY
jgi:hypothetical protein